MGTEMRIGIAVGVLIVAATSVYFIYGSDRSDGDLMITPETSVTDSKGASKKADTSKPKGTAAGAKDSRRVAASDARSPKTTPKPTVANRNARTTTPSGVAANRPTRRVNTPVQSPVTNRTNPALSNATKPDATTTATALADRRKSATGSTPVRGVNPATVRNVSDSTTPIDAAKTLNLSANDATKSDWISTKRDPAINPKPYRPSPSNASVSATADSNRTTTKSPEFGSISAIVKAADRSGTGQPKSVVLGNDATPSDRPVVLPRVGDSWPRRHTIASGDTLSDISMKYYDTSRKVDLILSANPDITGPRSLKIGRELVIPEPGAPVAPRSTSIVRTVSTRDSDESIVRRASVTRRSARTYTVKKGDTFYSIARDLYGSPSKWKMLLERNKSLVKNKASNLRPGMVLKIPA